MNLHSFFLISAFSASVFAQGKIPNVTITNSTTSMHQLSSDPEFAFVLETFMSLASGGGVATGEMLRAASRIKPGDFESFYSEFKFFADTMAQQAASIRDPAKFAVSAREAHFRAASYYRAADFFLHGNASDPRIMTLWTSMLENFEAGAKLLPQPPERIELNATGFRVPVYFYQAPSAVNGGQYKHKAPTVLFGTGYDGAQQDIYHQFAHEVLARGWNFATYEGPGQATVRREQNIGFIPQWWDAVTPVVDWLQSRDDVDTDRIALVGLSFGGQLAPLAASHEHRFSAVIAIDGMLDIQESALQKYPEQIVELYKSGNATAFDFIMRKIYNTPGTSTEFKWALDQGMWSFNTESPFEWIKKMSEMAISKEMLNNISSPVFVASAQDDSVAPGQPEEMARLLGDKGTYHLFKTNIGAGEHCSLGAESQLSTVTMDWLTGVFENVTKSI
ncbi:Alpha/Beta hydrolase protein [Talaromyces proteolyticus]|uniref:Alpha/Beta hydrolase protein n=1 Tax=Talaromyces proteolyticus TaxID=1131652 RepID=A0AAD4L1S8_9EURO|nr:Alpha/Beta hydrolase protein [Talaromyces proteolyticus]KAH8705977.1 Alpha/Beta hydrolase protein [Talaromyces proteolyticus]